MTESNPDELAELVAIFGNHDARRQTADTTTDRTSEPSSAQLADELKSTLTALFGNTDTNKEN